MIGHTLIALSIVFGSWFIARELLRIDEALWALYGQNDDELSCEEEELLNKALKFTERITVRLERLAGALRKLDEKTPSGNR